MFVDIPLPFGLGLLELQQQDLAFSETLFASTRDHLRQLPIPKSQINFLIAQQFQLQQASYAATFPAAKTFVIALYSQPVGKIILNQTPDSLHIVDIAFVEHMRNKGFGRALLRALKTRAKEHEISLSLSVDQQNVRAKKLYLELGFTLAGSSSTHDSLRWD